MGNSRISTPARTGAFLPESSLIELCMLLALVKLDFKWKFFRGANLCWFNGESCSTTRLPWPLMDRRCTHQLLGLDRVIISTLVTMLTGHCVMDRHAERMRVDLKASAVNADKLRKTKLLSTLFFSARLLLDTDIDYLAFHFMSTETIIY